MEQATILNGDCIKSCDDVPKQYEVRVAGDGLYLLR